MFEKFLRKTVMKKLSKEDQEIAMLLKDKFKMYYLAKFLVLLFAVLPMATLFTLLIECENTLSHVVLCTALIVAYTIFALYFAYRFYEPIQTFTQLIALTLYCERYIVKGNAISKEDFDTIKEENEGLYRHITKLKCKGQCYGTSFDLLKCLKKGTIQFTAVRSMAGNEESNEYTMHVLYVNNGWCFDTYSGRQHPLSEVMRRYKGKVYTTYSYEDIKGKTYEEFKEEHQYALKKWCKENCCYTVWLED